MPIANAFLEPAAFHDEYFFNLSVSFCPRCTMVQLAELVDREKMFHEHYAFFSSTSTRMAEHFREFADWVLSDHLYGSSDPFILELGSNDGILLQHFARRSMRHLGVEPSANVAEVAREKGIRTVSRFFDESLAREVLAENGHAHAILGANVMCHIPYLHSVIAGFKILLAPDGVIAFEDPYLGDIVEKTAYDQIYDEHAFYFSVSSIESVIAPHELELIDVIPQNVHGGSMRYVITHKGARPVSTSVARQREKELTLGLGEPATWDRFRSSVERSRDALVNLLRDLRSAGKRIVGYAATSKSTTVMNYCGITSDLVEFISDTTPIKQGKFSPGAHIPVLPHDAFARDYPDYALLLAWNHSEEIMAREETFRRAGGRWIVFVPEVRVLE